ncbi:MAG: hypothetical protein IVW53_15185 [Chloroflexi bacterium]|nr:hypothetical protein [Chloroflexota bacterium]
MLIRRRMGVRATEPDAMGRQFALLRGFRDLEARRLTFGGALGVVAVAIFGIAVAEAKPGPLGTLAAFAAAVGAFVVVTFGVAWVFRPRPIARALEAYRWSARAAADRWRRLTGEPIPRTPSAARAWLETHPAVRRPEDLARIELLVWIGEFEAARRVVATLPERTPMERFDRALERAFVGFVADRDGDLEPVRRALGELEAGPTASDPDQLRLADLLLAVEDARQRAVYGGDWLEPLLAARDRLGASVDGLLLGDLVRWTVRPLVILGLVSAAVSFIAAGAVPTH